MKRLFVLLFCALGVAGAPNARLAAQSVAPSIEERFKAEYPAAVQRYQEMLRHISGSGRRLFFVLGDAEAKAKPELPDRGVPDRDRATMRKLKSEEVRFALDGPLMRATIRPTTGLAAAPKPAANDKPLNFEQAACVNLTSAFEVAWAKAGAPPRLAGISDPSDKHPFNVVMIATYTYLDSIMYPYGVPREKTFPSSDFVVRKFTPSTVDGVELLRVDYEIKYTKDELAKMGKQKADRATTSGWFVVRPDDGWVIQEAMVSNAHQANNVYVKIDYDTKQDGVLLPKQIALVSPVADRVLELDTIRHGPTPESEFTLTAFGLPEINQTPKVDNPNRNAYWLIGAGVVVLLAAIGLKVYARRVKVAA